MNTLKSMAAALEVDMHNLEQRPRTELIGVRWGYAGVAAGAFLATASIVADYAFGNGTAYSAGVGIGLVGVIAGVSCAVIGFASNQGWTRRDG